MPYDENEYGAGQEGQEDFDLGQDTQESARKSTGGGIGHEGFFHCEVTDYKYNADKDGNADKDAHVLTFTILNGNLLENGKLLDDPLPESLIAKTHQEWIYKSEKAKPRRKMLAARLQLFSSKDYGSTSRVNFADAVGRHVVLEIRKNEYKDSSGQAKSNYKIPYAGIYEPWSEEVKDVSLDQAALQDAGLLRKVNEARASYGRKSGGAKQPPPKRGGRSDDSV